MLHVVTPLWSCACMAMRLKQAHAEAHAQETNLVFNCASLHGCTFHSYRNAQAHSCRMVGGLGRMCARCSPRVSALELPPGLPEHALWTVGKMLMAVGVLRPTPSGRAGGWAPVLLVKQRRAADDWAAAGCLCQAAPCRCPQLADDRRWSEQHGRRRRGRGSRRPCRRGQHCRGARSRLTGPGSGVGRQLYCYRERQSYGYKTSPHSL